jgi:hypothetical protein
MPLRLSDSGLKAEIGKPPPWGQERRIGVVRNISALPSGADVGADIVEPPVRAKSGCEQSQQGSTLFDHLVGTCEQHRGHFDAERPRCLEVDDKLEFCRLQHWQVSGLHALEDLTGVNTNLTVHIQTIC